MRFEGPIARQNQHLFAGDWMARVDDDIDDLLRRQESYIAKSLPVTHEVVESWSWQRRLWNNAASDAGAGALISS